VILTDALAGHAAMKWTPEGLRNRIGDHEVSIRTPSGPLRIPFDVLTDLVLASTDNSPSLYARNINIERDLPDLWPEIQPRLPYASPDWKSSSLLPRDFIFPNGLVELFFGGQGTEFPRLHVDYWGMDGFISQIYGEKEFVLFGPEQTPFLYPGPDDGLTSLIGDLDHPDLERFPLFEQARPVRFRLTPGETLYLPNGWWHTTRMPGVSITAITATWHRSNWARFIQTYRRRGRTRGVAKLAVLSWLVLTGLVLRMRDRVLH